MNNNIGRYDIYKKNFLELYENSKKGNVDVYKLSQETLEKMCTLLEEEIKIVRRDIEKIKAKLDVC